MVNSQTMGIIIEYMQQLTNTSFDYMYYMTAERGESSVWHRQQFYE